MFEEDERPSLAFEYDQNIATAGLKDFLRKIRKRINIAPGQPPAPLLSEVIAHPSYTALYNLQGVKIPEGSMYVWPYNVPVDVKAKFVREHEMFEPDEIDPTCVEVVYKDPIVFGGARHAHFGHHLLDGMSRLWFHRRDMKTLYLDAHPKRLGYGGFMDELASLGRKRRFHDLRVPTRFERMIVPHPAIQSGFFIYDAVDAEHLAIAKAALKRARRPVPSKIYLTRRQMGRRRAVGEDELEERLAAYGFAIIAPETLSVVEQISLFNRAEWIIGATGSAFHNTLFMRRGAPLTTVQLTVRAPNIRYPMIDRVKGNRSYYLRTMKPIEIFRHKIVSAELDVEETLAILKTIGALEPRLFFGYRSKLQWPRSLAGFKDRIVGTAASKPGA